MSIMANLNISFNVSIFSVQVCQKNVIYILYKQKVYLIQLYIVIRYVKIFKDQICGLIDSNNRKILNFLPFVNFNNICAVDKCFQQFLDEIDSWWLNTFFNMSYEPTR